MNASTLIETKAIRTSLIDNRAAKHKDVKSKARNIKFHTTVSLCGVVWRSGPTEFRKGTRLPSARHGSDRQNYFTLFWKVCDRHLRMPDSARDLSVCVLWSSSSPSSIELSSRTSSVGTTTFDFPFVVPKEIALDCLTRSLRDSWVTGKRRKSLDWGISSQLSQVELHWERSRQGPEICFSGEP